MSPKSFPKNHILSEIRRTARENGGAPLGKQRFYAETGIKETDWSGRYWARWSDALAEAGFPANTLQGAFDESFLLQSLAHLVRDLGRLPAAAELKLRKRQDDRFPSHNTFRRFGRKAGLAARLKAWCESQGGFPDVVAICETASTGATEPVETRMGREEIVFGAVYPLKSGRFYKVGRTNAVGRRERELAIQLPEKARVVHEIRTDDPTGIEAYWHDRFRERHKNGEWFELTPDDVAAFRRRKFM